MGTALKMKCLSFCAVMLMLVIALVIGAADEPHDLSSLDQRASVEAASPTDDLESLSKEQLLSLFTGQVADLKKQSANQNAAHDEQVADLQKQNAAHEERVAALKARLDGASRLAAAKNDELGEQTMMKTVMQGRFGVGGVLTAGLDAEQNGGFEEKELGEVALVSDPELYVKSTLKSGDKISSTNGMGPSACSNPFIKCNAALCEGQIPGFSGGLNCPKFTSTDCPDDLSRFSFLKITAGRKVTCVSFSHISAAKSVLACGRYGTGRVCTKPAFLHPNGASKNVVGIMLKRLVCSGTPEKCFTHKMGYCISNQKSGQLPYFSSKLTPLIKPNEYGPAQKMLKGKWTDIFDTKNGGIKAEWACGAEDTKIFKDTIMAF